MNTFPKVGNILVCTRRTYFKHIAQGDFCLVLEVYDHKTVVDMTILCNGIVNDYSILKTTFFSLFRIVTNED